MHVKKLPKILISDPEFMRGGKNGIEEQKGGQSMVDDGDIVASSREFNKRESQPTVLVSDVFDVESEDHNMVSGVQVGEYRNKDMHQKKLPRVQESAVEVDVGDGMQDGQENLVRNQESTPAAEFDMEKAGHNEIDGIEMSDSSNEFEEWLTNIPFDDCNSDEDEETTEARNKVKRYVQLTEEFAEGNNEQVDNEEGDGGQPTLGDQPIDSGKVQGVC